MYSLGLGFSTSKIGILGLARPLFQVVLLYKADSLLAFIFAAHPTSPQQHLQRGGTQQGIRCSGVRRIRFKFRLCRLWLCNLEPITETL